MHVGAKNERVHCVGILQLSDFQCFPGPIISFDSEAFYFFYSYSRSHLNGTTKKVHLGGKDLVRVVPENVLWEEVSKLGTCWSILSPLATSKRIRSPCWLLSLNIHICWLVAHGTSKYFRSSIPCAWDDSPELGAYWNL